MSEKRRDSKNRILRNGESQRKVDIPFEKCTLFGISVHPYPV